MAYIVEARTEGETEQYESALGVLIFRWEPIFNRRVTRRIAHYCSESGYLSVGSEAEEIVLETFKSLQMRYPETSDERRKELLAIRKRLAIEDPSSSAWKRAGSPKVKP